MHEELRKLVLGQKHTRTSSIPAGAIDKEARTIEMSFLNETPVVRWWGIEVLSCKPENMRMQRMQGGLPFLANHDPSDQRGRIDPCRCDPDRTVRGLVRFSRTAAGEELWMDHMDGIRKETSGGYIVHNAEEMKPEEMSDELKNLALAEGVPVYRITDWEPIEGSSVSMPAVTNVGAGRSLEYYEGRAEDDIVKLLEKINSRSSDAIIHEREHRMTDVEKAEQEKKDLAERQRLSAEELQKREQERVSEIESIATRFKDRIQGVKMDDLKRDAVDLKIPVENFRGMIFSRVHDSKPLEVPATEIGLTEKEKRQYSLRNVILAQIPNSGVTADFERECSKAASDKLGRAARGMLVPYEIQTMQRELPKDFERELKALTSRFGIKMGMRDLTVGSATAGGNLVATNLLAGSFIELLRNKALSTQLGVQLWPGLVGNVAIPKQTGASTFYWVAENTGLTESAPTFGQVTLSPRSGGAYVDIGRQLLKQSTPAVDMLVLGDLTKVCALGVDKAVFHGTGSGNNQPTGIELVSNIGSQDGTDFGLATSLAMIVDVMKANADVATMNYVTNPTIWGTLKARPLAASGYPVFIIDTNDRMNGYPVGVTNQISANYIFFGDFAQSILGEWGVLDILVDPYTGGTAGTVRVIAFISVDHAVRQAGAYSITSSFS